MMRSTLSRRNLLRGAAAAVAAAPTYSLAGSPLNDSSESNRKSSIARIVTT